MQTSDFMTADFWYPPKEFIKKVSLRITNEVDGVSRVVYDLTSKPPGELLKGFLFVFCFIASITAHIWIGTIEME